MLRGARGVSSHLRAVAQAGAAAARPIPSLAAARAMRLLAPTQHGMLLSARVVIPQVPSRGFAAGLTSNDEAAKAQVLLKHAEVIQLRENLEMEAFETPFILYDDLLQRCRQTLKSDDEAVALADALCDSGCVLRWNDVVYLRPAEIARDVLAQLPPTSTPDQEAAIAHIKEQLAPLEEVKEAVDTAARRRVTALQWVGLAVLLAQWSLFFRLTFWELSWDVMEPVSYFAGGSVVIGAYIYFMMTQRDMSYETMMQRMESKYKQEGYTGRNFDIHQYNKLTSSVRKLEAMARKAPK